MRESLYFDARTRAPAYTNKPIAYQSSLGLSDGGTLDYTVEFVRPSDTSSFYVPSTSKVCAPEGGYCNACMGIVYMGPATETTATSSWAKMPSQKSRFKDTTDWGWQSWADEEPFSSPSGVFCSPIGHGDGLFVDNFPGVVKHCICVEWPQPELMW